MLIVMDLMVRAVSQALPFLPAVEEALPRASSLPREKEARGRYAHALQLLTTALEVSNCSPQFSAAWLLLIC